jgi:hypothetical protein
MKNSHKIKSLRENLSAKVDAIKGLVKHCEMMNNKVEQMISLQNQLYENFIEKKQVCGVNTREGASTQDPDFPDGHPKIREQDALKNKSLQENLPMRMKIMVILKNKIMILLFLMVRLKIITMRMKMRN